MEWIEAHGFHPRGVWSQKPVSTGNTAAGVCAFAQQTADFCRDQPGTPVIFTTGCDQMRRAGDLAGTELRSFLFNLPATWQSTTARRLYRNELERLGRFLVRLGGRTPADRDLEEILVDWDCRRQEVRELLPGAGGRSAAEMLLAFFEDGRVVHAVPGAASDLIPVALVGGPLLPGQLGLFDAIEALGGRVALNAAEPGERCLLPPLPCRRPGADPVTLMADHYFDHSLDVFHRPNTRLYTWLGARLAERRVRGILLWVHVGCDLWRAEAASLREAFGLPVLTLDEHETREVGPRDLTRLGAFLETLR